MGTSPCETLFLFVADLLQVIMDGHAFYDGHEPLRFRGVSDSLARQHVEGSECCLIHADNSLTAEKGIFMHPGVRVGYNPTAYDVVNPIGERWMSAWTISVGLWQNRLTRWFTTPAFKEWVIQRRTASWQKSVAGRVEAGVHCLVNEMQVLTWYGWAHV